MGDFTPAADEFCFRESTSFCSLHLKNVNEHLKAETVLVQFQWQINLPENIRDHHSAEAHAVAA